MKLLLIESSDLSAHVSVCTGSSLTTTELPEGMTHGAQLVPAIRAALAEAGLAPGQLDGIGIDIGPGSYTGLRVGVSAAKTLAHFAEVPLVGLSSLGLLVQNLEPTEGASASPLVVARMKSVYAAHFKAEGGTWHRQCDDRVARPEDLPEVLPAGAIVFGNAVGRFAEQLAELGYTINQTAHPHVRPEALAEATRQRIEAEQVDDPLGLQVAYLKEPRVILKRKAF